MLFLLVRFWKRVKNALKRILGMYNVFNSIKHAVDLSIIQTMTDYPLTDAKLVGGLNLNARSLNSNAK